MKKIILTITIGGKSQLWMEGNFSALILQCSRDSTVHDAVTLK